MLRFSHIHCKIRQNITKYKKCPCFLLFDSCRLLFPVSYYVPEMNISALSVVVNNRYRCRCLCGLKGGADYGNTGTTFLFFSFRCNQSGLLFAVSDFTYIFALFLRIGTIII